jgi:acetyl esterase/lipase
MKEVYFILAALIFVAGCGRPDTPQPGQPSGPGAGGLADKIVSLPEAGGQPAPKDSLLEARRGFQTELLRKGSAKKPIPEPPARLFWAVRYDSPAGKLAAYVSPDPHDGKKHPAIIWIFGGFANSIGDTAWEDAPPSNDQSASAFRKAGILMMYPSFRGGNDNPGFKEGFFGEVDDVLAATDYLRKQEFIDPTRIYLGGHSTGGTLALLVAECSDRYRAVFSFGPAADVKDYGPWNLPFNVADRREAELRAPIRWLSAIRNPVFVFEGTQRGNVADLEAMRRASTNPLIHFYSIRGATHFSTLAPITRLIAGEILRDDGPTVNIWFGEEGLNDLFQK